MYFLIAVALIGILSITSMQFHWLNQALTHEEEKFNQNVHIALLEVVKKIYDSKNIDLPLTNPIKQINKEYFIIDINQDFDPKLLDHFLKSEFALNNINTNFEYAIYDCNSDKMLYGKRILQNETAQRSEYFPKFENLVYYFAVRFPDKPAFLFSSMQTWLTFSGLLFVILLICVYFIFIMLQQKKYAELQRDFINNMTHEFKTPLSSILIASRFLQKNYNNAENPRAFKYSEMITQQALKLNNHVEKVLNLAKSENEALKLNLQKIQVISLISEVIETMSMKYPEARITFDFDIDIPENIQFAIDRDHFSNVLLNLIDNSIKYCDNKPIITIKLFLHNNSHKLSLLDNGIGIPQKNLKYLFKKFYRVPKGNQNYVNGFGLGLFYVKRICDLHHFKINLESQVGTGTCVTITLD